MKGKVWLSMNDIPDRDGENPEWTKVWKVDDDGTMECLLNGYWIGGNQLTEMNWIEHLALKTWCDLRYFLPAYSVALRKVGINNVKTSDLYFEA